MPTNILGNEIPLEKSIAQFDDSGSRGVIEMSDGRVFSYHRDRVKGERFREEAEGFQPLLWLRPATAKILFRPADDPPFPELEAELDLLWRVSIALRFFAHSLSPMLNEGSRRTAARKTTSVLEEEAVRARVEPLLLDAPMPAEYVTDCGPTEGNAGEILKKMIAKWRPRGANVEMAYDVSFRERKKLSELDSREGATFADYLRSIGADIVQAAPDGLSVGIWATPAQVCAMHLKIGAVCRIEPRVVAAAA